MIISDQFIKHMRNFEKLRLSEPDQKIISDYFELIERLKNPNGSVVSRIIMAVIDTYEITQKQLMVKTRAAEVVRARHTLYYLLGQFSSLSLSEIGNSLGLRQHHSTVIHSKQKVEAWRGTMKWDKVEECSSKIKNT